MAGAGKLVLSLVTSDPKFDLGLFARSGANVELRDVLPFVGSPPLYARAELAAPVRARIDFTLSLKPLFEPG